MRLWWLCILWAVHGAAQTAPLDDDSSQLLIEVRFKVMHAVNRLPRYLCTETVDRSTFLASGRARRASCDTLRKKPKNGSKLHEQKSDRLRLDVAVSRDGEMYSWIGENRFGDRSLADLVANGATSTGAFSSFLISIFGSGLATFTREGNVSKDSRNLARFAFQMPLEKSRYSIGNRLEHATVAYHGTFLVDPKTFDLVQLTIQVDDIPPEFRACQETTTLDYTNQRLNNADFILPRQASLHIIRSDGSELDNRTIFSGCHEFLGESKLRFDAPEAVNASAPQVTATPVNLPTDMPFTLELNGSIDTRTAAAGDPVRAILVNAIKGKHRGVLIPKGAAINGRIVRMERLYGPSFDSLALAIRLETIEANGLVQPFPAKLDSALERTRRRGLAGELFSYEEGSDLNAGVLEFDDIGSNYVVKGGLRLDGRTMTR